ncbi:DivIVA domain-containing protein [Gelria sp. Kuro-4]|uniref:DivIVA domain-containing protein n=1 Tax=Gelria sp. Kuro-4 TaxID=2796927 RepID=UPI001BF12A1C|nr:DivIVA domain-containing protein [Gelria sp. Kuro-4]MDK2926379.1 cell division initiation protein [Bacillota bacterium]BCV24719.1 DivIVA domain-containing protein [Gelria sp. Kuro-4]
MLTPLDIQKKEFHRRLRGYSEAEVDEFLDQVLEDYELLYRQNASLKDEVGRLRAETERYANLEETLKNTLVLAQKAADATRTNAEKEAELIISQARSEAQALAEEGRRRLKELEEEYSRLQSEVAAYKAQTRALLLGAVALLDAPAEEKGEAEADGAGETGAQPDGGS